MHSEKQVNPYHS